MITKRWTDGGSTSDKSTMIHATTVISRSWNAVYREKSPRIFSRAIVYKTRYTRERETDGGREFSLRRGPSAVHEATETEEIKVRLASLSLSLFLLFPSTRPYMVARCESLACAVRGTATRNFISLRRKYAAAFIIAPNGLNLSPCDNRTYFRVISAARGKERKKEREAKLYLNSRTALMYFKCTRLLIAPLKRLYWHSASYQDYTNVT